MIVFISKPTTTFWQEICPKSGNDQDWRELAAEEGKQESKQNDMVINYCTPGWIFVEINWNFLLSICWIIDIGAGSQGTRKV